MARNIYIITQEVCKKCNADLKIIDNYTDFDKIFNGIVFPDGSNAWAVGTLTGIYSINDFINSDYEEFLWMDLDLVCLKFYDLFKHLAPSIYMKGYTEYKFTDWLDIAKKEFYHKFHDGPFYSVSSGKYRLNKFWAKKIIEFLNKIDWNPINYKRFSDKINGGFTPTEETLLNVFFGGYWPELMFIEPFYEPYKIYENDFLHFPSNTKIFLIDYIKNNPVNY